MRELDNIAVASLEVLLNENTTLTRFYPLIPIKETLVQRLLDAGIGDKYEFLERAGQLPQLAAALKLDMEVVKLLENFLHLHDFVNRRLKDVDCVNTQFQEGLALGGVKTSQDYLLLCTCRTWKELSQDNDGTEEDAQKLFCICDLMRLPGVKSTRASLYYDCGYRTLEDFSCQSKEELQRYMAQYIEENQMKRSVPFPKELDTQIAAAKVLPHWKPLSYRALRET